jgi:outer membrane protein TolC
LATAEEVITEQQNLAIAEGHVIRARATYAKALIQYEEATGTLLDRHHIALSEAIEGEVNGAPTNPGEHVPPE